MTLYETPDDRAAAEAIVRLYCKPGEQYRMTKPLSIYDALILREEVPTKIVEVKVRGNPQRQYETLTVDVVKVNELLRLARERQVLAVLLVAWTDRVASVELSKAVDWVADWEVTDQTRKRDGEMPDPVYHIPVGQFTDLW